MQCLNNLKQTTLALHSFHDVHNRFPAASFDPLATQLRIRRCGMFPLLLPYMEQQPLYASMMVQGRYDIPANVTDGRWEEAILVRPQGSVALTTFRCPSDASGRGNFTNQQQRDGTYLSFSNYRACRADLVGEDTNDYLGLPGEVFVVERKFPCPCGTGDITSTSRTPLQQWNMPRSWARTHAFVGNFQTVTSGLTNTIALSEGLIGADHGNRTYRDTIAWGTHADYHELAQFGRTPEDCLNLKGSMGQFRSPTQATWPDRNHWLGRRIWDNTPGAYAFYTILPPNSPSCSRTQTNGLISATSHHRGGVNVSFLDGSVRFISNTIGTSLGTIGGEMRTGTVHSYTYIPTDCDGNPIPPGEPVTIEWTTYSEITTTPDFPADVNGNRFSYGIWAELGAINSREVIPSL